MTNRSPEEMDARHKEIARQQHYGRADAAVDGLLEGLTDPQLKDDIEASLEQEPDPVELAEERRLKAEAAEAANNKRYRSISPAGIEALGGYGTARFDGGLPPIAPPLPPKD